MATTYHKLVFPDDAYVNWQLYRSRQQFHAVQIDHPFSLNGEKGRAGDYVAHDGGGYEIVDAAFVEGFQPISNTERAK